MEGLSIVYIYSSCPLFLFPSVVCHDSVVAVDNVQSRELVGLFTGYSAV